VVKAIVEIVCFADAVRSGVATPRAMMRAYMTHLPFLVAAV
jgi:hypothetical protein